jgi:hypothetical protein
MHQDKETGIFMVVQDQERIPISDDNDNRVGRDNANAVDYESE